MVTRQRVPDFQLAGGYACLAGKNSPSGSFEHGAYAGVSLVNIPLFYNFSPEIKNAVLRVKQAELNHISIENKATKDVVAAYEKFLTAAENLNHYEAKIITGSTSLIDISKNSYEKGEIDAEAASIILQDFIENFKPVTENAENASAQEVTGKKVIVEKVENAAEVGSLKVVTAFLEDTTVDELRKMCDLVKSKGENYVGVIAGVQKAKGTGNICVCCGKDAISAGAHSGNIAREVAKLAGGSGGGKPDSAMAGAKDVTALPDAVKKAAEIISGMLK